MAEIVTDARPSTEMLASARMQLQERLGGIISRLEAEATSRVGKRKHIEDRWVEDLQQYHGKYDHDTEKKLKDADASRLFLNLTRAKTDAMSARLMDLLFPTDDRNWGIQPTPVPELEESAEKAAAEISAAREQAEKAKEEGGQVPPELSRQLSAMERIAAELNDRREEARRRAEAMMREIDDQLKQSRFQAISRDVIEDGCKLGTGVGKGPVTGMKQRRGWKLMPVKGPDGKPQLGPDGQPVKQFQMDVSEQNAPGMLGVDLWNWFPDMDARTVDESEGFFERHLMNAKRLRRLAQNKGFDKDAIRRLLLDKPRSSAPDYLQTLRKVTESNDSITGELYHVWEYQGPLAGEDMRDIALWLGDADLVDEMGEADPLQELQAVVWFCQGELLKFGIYPLDSNEPLYSVFNLFKDEASIFGYGIPFAIRNPQRMLNSAARMLMDNGGLSTGPIIVVDKKQVTPADGKWTIAPRKLFFRTGEGNPEIPAFDQFNIEGHTEELIALMELSMRFIDDLASLPVIAQGDQGTHTTQTSGGMTILMNSANVVFRRMVKNFDDDYTTPTIRRFYDWNMQFNPKEHIKGDYEVDARGSSVLLVRELQAQNLMIMAAQFAAHPVFGPMIKQRELFARLLQSQMIPADEILLSKTEFDELQQKIALAVEQAMQQAKTAAGPDPELEMAKLEIERERIEADIAISNRDNQTKLTISKQNYDAALIKLAETLNMDMEKVQAMLDDKREERSSKERIVAAEAAMKERSGDSAGGYV